MMSLSLPGLESLQRGDMDGAPCHPVSRAAGDALYRGRRVQPSAPKQWKPRQNSEEGFVGMMDGKRQGQSRLEDEA